MPHIPRARLLAAFMMLPAVGYATDFETPPTVNSVIVTATRDPEDPPPVAAARTRLARTPGAVSVVASESYASRYALNLADSLRDVAGVYARTKWGGDVRLSIRGSGIGNNAHNRGLILAQDGVPFNEADGFGDFQLIDPLIARYTEVYKGGNALRFGGALLGGAINQVTPTGRTAGAETALGLDGGAYGAARLHVELARVVGDWDGFAAATDAKAQGFRQQSQSALRYGSINIGRRFGPDREVRLYVSGGDIDQQIPGSVTRSQALAMPKAANAGNYANNYQRDMKSARGAMQTRWSLSDSASLEGGVYAIWKHLYHPIFQVIDQESRNYGGFVRLDWAGTLGDRKADGYAGLWARFGDLNAQQFANLRGNRGARTALSRQNAKAIDAVFEGRLFVLDDLALVGGGTWGRAERDYQSVALPSMPATFNLTRSKAWDWVAPRVGMLWQTKDGAQIFANVTRSVEPPNFSALSPTVGGFAPLRPQSAWTTEAGTRGRTGTLTWDLVVYRASLKRELLSFAVDSAHPATTFNAGNTVHQGIEAALDWHYAPRWRLRQTYTLSDFYFEQDSQYGNNRLPVVPLHVYRVGLRHEHPTGGFIEPTLEWTSDVWTDFRNTSKAPGYAIASLNAGWTFKAGPKLFIEVRNLTDKHYISNVSSTVSANAATATYWPGEGRAAYAGLSAAF